MKNVLAIALTCMLMQGCVTCALAQDPSFSQNFSAPLWVNPALAGATGAGRLAAIFRDQYVNLAGRYQAFYASYDHFVNKLGSGVGFYYLHDLAGDLGSSRFALAVSRGFDLFDKKFRIVPGLDADFVHRTLDTSGYNLPELLAQRNFFDMGAGLHALTERLNFSFAGHHLTQPNESMTKTGVSRLPLKYTFILDYVFGKLDEKRSLKVAPALKYEIQDNFYSYVGSIAFSYWKIKLGFAYKSNGYQIANWTPSNYMAVQAAYQGLVFKLRYAYDFGINNNAQTYGGTHEVTTLFNLFKRKKKDDFRDMQLFGF
jgi:type IX secretion system PorP/SprF family membrane protein